VVYNRFGVLDDPTTTLDKIVSWRRICAGIEAILTRLVQEDARNYEAEIADMPQMCIPFAADVKVQTLDKHVQANRHFC